MSSYRQTFYHIVYHTKFCRKTINETHSKELYNYTWGIIKNKNCKLYQNNGVEDHLHLLLDLHASISLADFMRELKSSSSKWMKESGNFPGFDGWAEGYGSFTHSIFDKDRITQYIKNQKEHHKVETFEDEYRRILIENVVTIDEKYFLK